MGLQAERVCPGTVWGSVIPEAKNAAVARTDWAPALLGLTFKFNELRWQLFLAVLSKDIPYIMWFRVA